MKELQERQLVNALNELDNIKQYLNVNLAEIATEFFRKFEEDENFSDYELGMIETLVETGMSLKEKNKS